VALNNVSQQLGSALGAALISTFVPPPPTTT
jgi:hypothetical protein